ncbi:MAG: antA/AntB antirepressor family protein [Bacillota bacterium]
MAELTPIEYGRREEKLMNGLQIFNKDIIPAYITDTGEKVVIGRELHERLVIGKDYSTWFKDMCDYGFTEGESYSPFSGDRSDGKAGKPRMEHLLTLDMAKHIAMIQRTPQGFAIRQKLIKLEKAVAQLSPTDMLELQVRALRDIEQRQAEQTKAIAATNARLDSLKDTITLNTQSWREDCRRLIVRIAQQLGGTSFIKDVQAEIFQLVDARAGVSLSTRLTNKRMRMADEGVCKSKRDQLNKVDVIADDKKLIEIYTAIVKEMAAKYLDSDGTQN